jgi:hypothetical protein
VLSSFHFSVLSRFHFSWSVWKISKKKLVQLQMYMSTWINFPFRTDKAYIIHSDYIHWLQSLSFFLLIFHLHVPSFVREYFFYVCHLFTYWSFTSAVSSFHISVLSRFHITYTDYKV